MPQRMRFSGEPLGALVFSLLPADLRCDLRCRYCAFHHALLFLAAQYPEMAQEASARYVKFRDNEGSLKSRTLPVMLLCYFAPDYSARLLVGRIPREEAHA